MDRLATAGAGQFTSSSLHDKKIVIFGGTSGIGLAAAIQAKAAGARVTIIGSNPARAQQGANEYGLDDWRVADVTRAETISEALADIMHVDHLVMLAGSFVVGKVHDADMTYLQRAFDERIWAAVHTIRILGDRLAAEGSITLISGALSDRPNAYGTAIIAAASAAMEALGRGMALELAPRRVNVLSPGPIDTPIFAKALGDGRDAYVASLSEKLPLRRLGTADEAGAAVVFLMANGWMNGEVLHVDGGARLV
ncbi:MULTISPECIES: SDR family oxidoreductase [Rhizobium]|uniref:SDR family oxidoreductase n=1 Tax=Rhizobium TaxID=379 RepID=UPI0007EB15F8|nr:MULTISPECIES: SDR family oxidoreductase [Rhizobium]ANK94543.1 short-chain dehydrogenase protein [Rhizobium sp. N6212]ANL00593.1 short-chain dehydrogenase protein [Rhizobium sp. N621]ANL06714.1 short-chain dehydrogenase protein [Rhizobium esperanzae]ANL12885.1 short-chain dehydrogenase protein [Rhizobium sp. N1341]ANM37558.1 short-chain dehydrogenase protein [Rhizobium sp. N871]